jgi:hypothetical protein
MTGTILDLTAADYHQDKIDDRPSLNASIAKVLLAESPLHAWHAHPRLNPNYIPSVDRKFDVGTVVHRMLLQPEQANHVAVIDALDWRTKAAQEVRDQAREDGNTPLLAGEWDRVQEMLTAVRDQINRLDVDPLPFYAGKAEQTICWEDERTSVLCRARIDWLHDGNRAVSDLKTTKLSANPATWSQRTLWSIGAHIQSAVYKRAVLATTGIEPDLRFVIAETSPPYAISVVSVAPSGLALAEAQFDHALDVWKRCLETNQWPAYPTQTVEAEAPPWLESQWWETQQLEGEVVS